MAGEAKWCRSLPDWIAAYDAWLRRMEPQDVADLSCPVCNADLPLAGDERAGDDVYCSYCGAPLVLRGKPEADLDERGLRGALEHLHPDHEAGVPLVEAFTISNWKAWMWSLS